jgi:hypothetical protein
MRLKRNYCKNKEKNQFDKIKDCGIAESRGNGWYSE